MENLAPSSSAPDPAWHGLCRGTFAAFDLATFNRRLNVSLRNLFRSLGYDGLVYANEIESTSDSYVIFSPRQVKILATGSASKTSSDREAA